MSITRAFPPSGSLAFASCSAWMNLSIVTSVSFHVRSYRWPDRPSARPSFASATAQPVRAATGAVTLATCSRGGVDSDAGGVEAFLGVALSLAGQCGRDRLLL